MKIIYLHQYFRTPAMSGGTRSYEMARRLVAAGHEVHIVTSSTDPDEALNDWYEEMVDGIHVHWLPVPYSNTMGFAKRLIAFSTFARKAGRYASKLSGDIVFATSTPLTIAIPGVRASRTLKVPLVFEVRDLWPEIPIALNVLKSPITKYLARRLEKWAYKNSDRVIGLSPGMCEGVVRAGYDASRVHCIPNSADLDLFAVSEKAGQDFRDSRAWLGDRPLVLYAGTFGFVNGVGYFADIARAALQLDPKICFLAVGNGAEYEKVKQRAAENGVLGKNFFMEPPVTKKEMPALLNAATLTTSLVIPNRALWHNSANKFFDSLAAGRPIFVNHGGWQAELLEEAGAGFEVPPDDASASAEKIINFLNDRARVESAGKAALDLARTRFDRSVLAGQLERVLSEAVQAVHA
ncbi:glycosyltransferase WbuB [Marinobacter maroccanus]|uniref:Glycosyltransferase WbuB n=1 Tax=Marinobacter maroccanus TaxID=2055143 RepID=A0A2S5ZF44_9GAMM|nr:glycosyltransferase family 4 protein [Marinobacter maroccanus]PPI86025.1 glycosyltransferase WbuB [Marinobacter maroccanus]